MLKASPHPATNMTASQTTDSATGTVFDIQRFSIHDGPGIRTAVFLKGCSLHCFWCHNPESIRPKPEIEFFADRCIGCGTCLEECPHNACSEVDGAIVYDSSKCKTCGTCQNFCFSETLVLVGREMTAHAVFEEIIRDRQFYRQSGGGITLTGGEPVLQTEFTRELLQRCKQAGIHTAIETAGNYHWEMLETLLPFIDLVMMDIKHLNMEAHQRATGVRNDRILENARRLAATNKPLFFRTPVVPTVNATPEEIQDIAGFIEDLVAIRQENQPEEASSITYELLRFHQLAGDKYRSLDVPYAAGDLEPPTIKHMNHLEQAAYTILDERLVCHVLQPDQ